MAQTGEKPASSRWRAITALAWLIALVALASSTLWMFASWSWRVDLAANLGAQMFLACLALALIIAATRRPLPFGVAILACILHAVPIVGHRAAFFPHTIDDARVRGKDEVRFLHYNDSCISDKKDVYALMDRSGADVLSILCPPVPMQFDVIYSHGLEDKYPGKLVREWKQSLDGFNTDVTAAFLVSRWPVARFDCSFVGPMSSRFIAGIVERPAGRFAVVAVHPRSPRWQERWEEGNDVAIALIAVSLKLESEGLPVVVLSDLNSTPSGWRSRHICAETDLRRAKPLFVCDGTYPDVVPWNLRARSSTNIPARWPLSIAIDDALISPDIEVTGWRVEARLKSEHRPVTVELRIPAPQTSGMNPGGR
jgi:endonuclease/exonuclease/phosphatase family metal-dependent hydrolase